MCRYKHSLPYKRRRHNRGLGCTSVPDPLWSGFQKPLVCLRASGYDVERTEEIRLLKETSFSSFVLDVI